MEILLHFLDVWRPPAESCFCFDSKLLCGEANLTEIPISPNGVSMNSHQSSWAIHASLESFFAQCFGILCYKL